MAKLPVYDPEKERRRLERITPTEWEVLSLISVGVRLKQAAVLLNLSYGYMKNVSFSAKNKLGLNTLGEVSVWWRETGKAMWEAKLKAEGKM